MLRTAQAIVRDQGTRALWRGNLTNCARYFPTQAINFACKERYQKLLVPDRANGFAPWFLGYLAAGGAAGATSLTVVYPLEFAYTRLAADVGAKKQFNGFYDAGKQVFFKDGGQNTSVFLKFGLALCVDISAAVFAYPVDTVRRRLMMQSGSTKVEFDGAGSAVRHIYRKEGVGGFFRGCMANNVRAIASAASSGDAW